MNKGLLGIIVAVVLAAMVLIMSNQKAMPPSKTTDIAGSGRVLSDSPANRTQSAAAQRSAVGISAGQMRSANATAPALAVPASSATAGGTVSAPPAVASFNSTVPAATAPPPLPKVDPPVSTPPTATGATAAKPASAGGVADTGATRPSSVATAATAAAAKPATDPAAGAAKPGSSAKPGTAATINPGKGPHTLKTIGLHFKGKAMVLRIESDNAFTGKTFVLPGPDRMVVDLAGNWNNMRAPTVPSNNLVKATRIGQQSSGPRLVLDLDRAPKKHDVTRPSPTVMEIVIE